MKYLSAVLLLLFSFLVHAQPDHAAEQPGLALSDGVRTLLNEEMRAIREGMAALAMAVPEGRWHDIAHTGMAIRDSYILKQKLTDAQLHELHRALPAEFQQLDGRFHRYAGMLAEAAIERDMERVNFYLYKMNEACTACHAAYAAHRFEGLNEAGRHDSHTH